ncbi:prolyl oligopeptidase family serine peptidase [Rhodanobacter ginsengisoli]|uniref:Prolyl oligopeptidase family serine peptidase n=1 Tax=Rhodanobacter ginsengisoli TaxID=418646 RepID=A0ABW0QVG7_9GAMM
MNCKTRPDRADMRQLVFLLALMTISLAGHAGESNHFVRRSLELHGVTYRYQVFVPDGWTARRRWPVVLFLHGSGERGSDNQAQLSQGLPPWLEQHGKDFPAVVVIPQAPDGTAWNGEIEQMALLVLDRSIDAWHGDRRRLYLTGLSMGGYGAWQIALDHPGRFAAAAIICGGIRHPNDDDSLFVEGIPADAGDPYAWVAAHIGRLPVWIFNGAIDDVVPPQESHRMHAALQARGDDVRYTEFPGVGHGAWPMAYATTELWPWMFAHRLGKPQGAH